MIISYLSINNAHLDVVIAASQSSSGKNEQNYTGAMYKQQYMQMEIP